MDGSIRGRGWIGITGRHVIVSWILPKKTPYGSELVWSTARVRWANGGIVMGRPWCLSSQWVVVKCVLLGLNAKTRGNDRFSRNVFKTKTGVYFPIFNCTVMIVRTSKSRTVNMRSKRRASGAKGLRGTQTER